MKHKYYPPTEFIHNHNRIGWVDWSKAIGILLVVMGHSDYSNPDIVPMIFMIHMPLFFVVSGYLFNADKSLKAITEKNIRGLLIPYILYNMLFVAYWILLGTLKTIIVIMCLHMLVNTQIYNVLHCQHQLLYTFAVDLMLTLLLACLYPLIKRYVPAMVGSTYSTKKA